MATRTIDPETPVSDPADYVGQAGLVRRIFSRIGAERPQSVAVIGGKKSGKTSLLAHIADPAVRAAHLAEGGSYEMCLVPSGGEGYQSPDQVLASLRRLLPQAGPARGNGYDGLRASVDALHAAGRRVVLLFDDFHLVTSNHAFPLEFFSFLRSLANNFNLAYVTTSFLELQKLCAIKDVQESPFFNIFTNLSLGMLSLEEGCRLLARLTGWDEAACAAVVRWCGASPYALKRAGARLLPMGAAPPRDDAALERLLLSELSPYFEEVVSLLPREAARPLQALAKGRPAEPSEAHYLGPLVKQGFLVEKAGAAECFSPAFCAFVRTRLSAKMLKGKA